MFGVETLSGQAQALATVGVVLAEAAVLYACYGAVTRVAAPAVRGALGEE